MDEGVLRTVPERLMRVETKIETIDDRLLHLTQKQEAMEAKIDELLDLKNQGKGAFWFVTALMSSGIAGVAVAFIEWIKGG